MQYPKAAGGAERHKMTKANDSYQKLEASYLFAGIARRVQEYTAANPDAKIVRLGIGDVTEPLAPAVVKAMAAAVREQGRRETFRGYGPEQGYAFLREAIAENDYAKRGVKVSPSEIFVSDGAKCDTGNFQELFDRRSTVAVPDPVYPVYVDTNVMAGRTGRQRNGRYGRIVYLDSVRENGFVPEPPSVHADIAYLCFPNNPTGAVATRRQLKKWVDWALREGSVILFDAAYEAFIRTPGVPHSIFEIPGARKCAVEFRSFSKTAGFTGTRCGFTVVPEGLEIEGGDGRPVRLHSMWMRRQTTKFNGCSYVTQRGAEAVYSPEGAAQTKKTIDFYLENARLIREALLRKGYAATGGTDSPYIWTDVGGDSWAFFDKLLREAQVVTTPGAGFGRAGEGFIRISAFNSRANVLEAIRRLEKAL